MKLFYVGFRESDICNSESFYGSITKYGTGADNNISFNKYRLNPFCGDNQVHQFFQDSLNYVLKQHTDAKFIFYCHTDAYKYGKTVFEHSIGVNSLSLLKLLDNRFFIRQFLGDSVKCPSYYILANNLINKDCLDRIFFSKKIVIQREGGAGGSTTNIINTSKLNRCKIPKSDMYLISEFIENGISVSTHILITSSDVVCFQPSIQLIKKDKLYYGADFDVIKKVNLKTIETIVNVSKMIGNKLSSIGYRGVCGLDFLVYDEDVFFIELNNRFMGSTILLNLHLLKLGCPTLQELHVAAVEGIPVKLSGYDYLSIISLKNTLVFDKDKIPSLQSGQYQILDGYDKNMPVQNGAYLYQIISYL